MFKRYCVRWFRCDVSSNLSQSQKEGNVMNTLNAQLSNLARTAKTVEEKDTK